MSSYDSIKVAQKRFRRETDTVAWFAEECLSIDVEDTVPRQTVYEEYVHWAEAQGVTADAQPEFNSRLEGLGAKRCRPRTEAGRVHSWRGIGLKES